MPDRGGAVKIQPTTMTIGELRSQLKREELTINHDYQRSPGVWPQSAKSYFIDTILAGFPFQKIYIYAHYDDTLDTEDKIKKEIVDGQQRVETMMEYLSNKFYVSTPSSDFLRKRYKDLDPDDRGRYINTMVEVDLILQATPSEVLEMFRRINSYMAPLRAAEKRHAAYNGPFKWFINSLADEYSPVLRSYGTLTPKQIVRMADAEFITELVQVLDEGIMDRRAAAFNRLYATYNKNFPGEAQYLRRIDEFFTLLTSTLKQFARSPLMKNYNLYSLFCALVGRKYGFPGSVKLGIKKRGSFFRSTASAVKILKALVRALEEEDLEGPFGEYVEATVATTHRLATRVPRAVLLAKYLDA